MVTAKTGEAIKVTSKDVDITYKTSGSWKLYTSVEGPEDENFIDTGQVLNSSPGQKAICHIKLLNGDTWIKIGSTSDNGEFSVYF